MATAADQKLTLVTVLRTGATDEGVQGRNPVHQPLLQEKVQRAVDRWRRRSSAILPRQGIENVVGAERLVAGPDQLQHPLAQRGEAHTGPLAQLLGGLQRITDTFAVVVGLMGIVRQILVRHR